MHRIAAVLIAMLLLSAQARGEEQGGEPATKLEQFVSSTGHVIVRSLADIGVVKGLHGSQLRVSATTYVSAATGAKVQGLVLEGVDAREREASVFIDADEIQGLMEGMVYISKVKQEDTELDHFEATYTTVGGFKVTAFNSPAAPTSVTYGFTLGRVAPLHVFVDRAGAQETVNVLREAQKRLESSAAPQVPLASP